MSESNAVRISYRAEGSSGPWQVLRRTGDSLTPSQSTTESAEVNSDRMVSDLILTGLEAAGGLEIEMSAGSFDDLIAAAMCSTWDEVSGELKIGAADTQFEILKSYTDIDKHVQFTGMRVSTFSLNIEAGAVMTGNIGFVGTAVDTAYDPSADTFDPAPDARVINAANDVGSIMFDGSALTGTCISAMTLELNNNFQAQNAIGQLTAYDQIKGSAGVTGTKTLAFTAESFDLWAKTVTQTPISSSFTVGDGTSSYTLSMGREKLSGDLPSGGKDEILEVELSSTATRDAATGSSLVITRTPV